MESFKRWPEAEHLITEPQDILWYCEFVLHGSWEEKEDLISKDSKASVAYAG